MKRRWRLLVAVALMWAAVGGLWLWGQAVGLPSGGIQEPNVKISMVVIAVVTIVPPTLVARSWWAIVVLPLAAWIAPSTIDYLDWVLSDCYRCEYYEPIPLFAIAPMFMAIHGGIIMVITAAEVGAIALWRRGAPLSRSTCRHGKG